MGLLLPRDDLLHATCRANAPRPAAVAVTVVCGFLPTNAASTSTEPTFARVSICTPGLPSVDPR